MKGDRIGMLTLTTDQMAHLEARSFERLTARLELAVLQVFPDLGQPPAEAGAGADAAGSVTSVVETGVTRALQFDLHGDADWAVFIALGLALRKRAGGGAPDWVTDCMQHTGLPGSSRLALIEWWMAREAATDASFEPVLQSMRDIRATLEA